MADKRIQDLPSASSVQLNDLFVLEQNGAAMNLSGQTLVTDLAAFLDGHGGIASVTYTPPVAPSLNGTLTLTMADGTTNSVTIANGNGIASIAIAYGISSQGTTPGYVTSWTSVPVPPTDANPYQWTRIRMTDKTGTVTDAYSVSMKAVNPTMTVGSVSAETGTDAGATVTNSGTSYNPVFNFDFTLPRGEKGDTGDYIVPVASFGASTSATTEPATWYNSPSSISYVAGTFIWQKTEYTMHEAQTVQSVETKVIGYIGQNGTGSGTVTQITFNGDVYADDGTGNVTMNITPEDVGAIADPVSKNDGQVLTYDSSAGAWVASTPSTGNVNTVNGVGVQVGTTNIQLPATAIPMSATDSTTVANAIPVASTDVPLADVPVGSVGSGTTWARKDHRHPLNVDSTNPADLGTASPGTATTYARRDHVHKLPSAVGTISFGTLWTDHSGYYTQTVTVTGATVTANSKIDLQPDKDAIALLAAAGATSMYIENNNGTLTAVLVGGFPSTSFTMQCTVTEVKT